MRIPKQYFFQRGPNFGEGMAENLGVMGNNRDTFCYANLGVANFEREYQQLPTGTKVLVILQFSYMSNQISTFLKCAKSLLIACETSGS